MLIKKVTRWVWIIKPRYFREEFRSFYSWNLLECQDSDPLCLIFACCKVYKTMTVKCQPFAAEQPRLIALESRYNKGIWIINRCNFTAACISAITSRYVSAFWQAGKICERGAFNIRDLFVASGFPFSAEHQDCLRFRGLLVATCNTSLAVCSDATLVRKSHAHLPPCLL